MFGMREGHAGSFCESSRISISSELLQVHGTPSFHSYFICFLSCVKDCGEVVASKFFPIDGSNGKQNPLCERDYFRRLNLICEKCGMALRGSYITACSASLFLQLAPLLILVPQTRSTMSTILLVHYVRPSLDPKIPITNMTTTSTVISIIRRDLQQNVQAVTVQF